MSKKKWYELRENCPWKHQDKGGQPTCIARSSRGIISGCKIENCAIYYFISHIPKDDL